MTSRPDDTAVLERSGTSALHPPRGLGLAATDPTVIAQRRWVTTLALMDLGIAFVSANASVLIVSARNPGVALDRYQGLAQLVPLLWVAALGATRAYDRRHLATGVEEFRRVANAGAWLIAITGFVAFALNEHVSRGFVLFCGTTTIGATLLARYLARRHLHHLLRAGACLHRAILVGNPATTADLRRHIGRSADAGIAIVESRELPHTDVSNPAAETASDNDADALIARAQEVGATMIVVARGAAQEPGALRHLSWRLEGTGIDLVVAPSVTDVAGPRIHVTPLSGLPLLHVEEPTLEGGRRLTKQLLDWTLALVTFVLLFPVLVCVAIAVKADDRGPIFYRQKRAGLRGEPFTIWKFRTMRVDAHEEHEGLIASASMGVAPFKITRDPRVTRVGSFLRRFSLDELPQLWNVLNGTMAMVGPRPYLEREQSQFGTDGHRRLLVKPGITGLWQVSGRSNLRGDEAVRLDLYYIDNWSIGLDLLILWKTALVVAVGNGAY